MSRSTTSSKHSNGLLKALITSMGSIFKVTLGSGRIQRISQRLCYGSQRLCYVRTSSNYEKREGMLITNVRTLGATIAVGIERRSASVTSFSPLVGLIFQFPVLRYRQCTTK